MSQFFISLILIGTVILISALAMIAFDWKKYNDGTEIFSEKIEKLQKMLDDADLMIEEMNGISSYIVENVENVEKKTEVLNNLFNQINNSYDKTGNIEMLSETTNEELKAGSANCCKQKEIAALCKEGLSDTEIAKKLNMGKGEVQLIMGINK